MRRSSLPETIAARIVRLMPQPGRFVSSLRVIALLTLASRILGLVRENLFGRYFGTGELLSAFRIAFMAPNLARRLFGEGALSAAMIPVLTETIQSNGEESARRFVGSLLTVLVAVLALAVIAIEVVILVWRSIYNDSALELTAIMMPYMAFICTVAVASGVLNVRGRFGEAAAAPIILNLGMIAALLGGGWSGLSGQSLMYAVCAGVLVTGVIQVVVTGGALRVDGFFPIFGAGRRDPRLRKVWTLMAPMILGLSAVPINSLLDSLIAYLFIFENQERVGPAVLGCAQFLYQLPLGVFGIALATAIFPVLSARAVDNDRAGMADVLSRGIRLSFFIALPASVGLIVVAEPLVATIYQHGVFDESDTRRVAATLICYSVGVVAYFMQHVIVRAFYALQDSKTPARIALYMVAMDFALNLVLVFPFEERGLALATAVCATIQVVWLLVRLNAVLRMDWAYVLAGAGKTLLAALIMSVALFALTRPAWFPALSTSGPAVQLVVLVAAGVVVYAAAGFVLRIPELTMVLRGSRDVRKRETISAIEG